MILLAEVEEWFLALCESDPETGNLVVGAIDLLEQEGPTLGRPAVDRIKGSNVHNLKELRPGSSDTTEVRILFVFDPQRQAVLLVGGDKSGQWAEWYADNVPIAERRYEKWLKEQQ
ncbi:MAG TPA: type II toxin-antitoxin system RelE/ParE family toxin [Mycobacteriales bacterium]|nr:type II toxin-antitoxin system RelE/ParE family toxin [Mycobacteriales bacterium]